MYQRSSRHRVTRGLADVYDTSNAAVIDLLREQQKRLPQSYGPGIPDPSYVPPSPTGCAAYVAVLPDGRTVTVSSCDGRGLDAKVTPTSIEELKGPGVTIQNTDKPGGEVIWSSGGPSGQGQKKVVQDPKTGAAVPVQEALPKLPTWALVSAAAILALAVIS